MDPAPGQPPQQKRVDGAKGQLAGLRAGTCASDIVEDPGDFGAGKIRIQQQPGFGGDHVLVAIFLEFFAKIGGAPVLPNNRPVQGSAGFTVPHQGGFALIGDADGGNVAGFDPGLAHRVAGGLQGRVPNVLRFMLDPARMREMLLELLRVTGNNAAITIEHNRPAGCGALVDGKHETHLWSPQRIW